MAKMTKKPDFDKESMFRKIMPSAAYPGGEVDDSPAETFYEAIPSPVTKDAVTAPILRSGGVQIRKKDNQILVNVMEMLVIERLDEAFAKFKCCKCDKCRKDVAALALNILPAKYVVIEEDKVSDYVEHTRSPEVAAAIVKAIIQVRGTPRHR